MNARPTLDVSHLPPLSFDHRSTSWWGNVLFMVIETTTTALLLVSYYYTWQGANLWPPSLADRGIDTANPYPDLIAPTLNLLLLGATCWIMRRAEKDARRYHAPGVRHGLMLLFALGCVSIGLRFREFAALKFRWDDNAYGSLTWALLFLHLTYLIVGVIEVGLLLLWVVIYGLDENQADDVVLTSLYWFWMVGLWVPLYLTIFWAPRLM